MLVIVVTAVFPTEHVLVIQGAPASGSQTSFQPQKGNDGTRGRGPRQPGETEEFVTSASIVDPCLRVGVAPG